MLLFATLVKYFWSLSKVFGFCLIFLVLYSLFEALCCLLGLCIVCRVFVQSVGAWDQDPGGCGPGTRARSTQTPGFLIPGSWVPRWVWPMAWAQAINTQTIVNIIGYSLFTRSNYLYHRFVQGKNSYLLDGEIQTGSNSHTTKPMLAFYICTASVFATITIGNMTANLPYRTLIKTLLLIGIPF